MRGVTPLLAVATPMIAALPTLAKGASLSTAELSSVVPAGPAVLVGAASLGRRRLQPAAG
jgi:hypothetical protein